MSSPRNKGNQKTESGIGLYHAKHEMGTARLQRFSFRPQAGQMGYAKKTYLTQPRKPHLWIATCGANLKTGSTPAFRPTEILDSIDRILRVRPFPTQPTIHPVTHGKGSPTLFPTTTANPAWHLSRPSRIRVNSSPPSSRPPDVFSRTRRLQFP